MDGRNRFWLTHRGTNPILINNREIQKDTEHVVQPGQKIRICSYTLVIQPLKPKKEASAKRKAGPNKSSKKKGSKRRV
jgi:hypothetical protein